MKMHPAFAKTADQPRIPAPAVVVVPPSGFGPGKFKPREPVSVGLRCLSADETAKALEHANREAAREDLRGEVFEEVYNHAIKRHVLCVACCDPLNADSAFFKEVPNDAIRVRFTAATIHALWQRYEALVLSSSPLVAEADDDDARELAEMLSRGVMAIARPETRRLLTIALDELRAAIESDG